MQELNLAGGPGNCTEDFVQFGRDVLFITTHLRSDISILSRAIQIFQFSDKLCGKIPKLSPAPSNSSEETWPSRNYIEDSDTEMDIWIYMLKSSQFKSLSLLVTPFRKTCDPKDHFYRACHKQNRLVAWTSSFISPGAPHKLKTLELFRQFDWLDLICRRCIRTELWCDGVPNCPPSADNSYPG